MKKIVENAVFREDTEYFEEITEQFIEFLNENIDIVYTNVKYWSLKYSQY